MTPSARLQAVFDLLREIRGVPRPADALVSAYFRTRRYIGSKDRAAVSAMFYDIVRHHARLGWWLEKIGTEDTPRTRGIVWLALANGKSPEQIGELFGGGKFAPGRLSNNETSLLANLKGHTIEHPLMPENVRVECPEWAAESLQQRFGKNFAREMRALLEPAPLDIRVNVLKTTRDAIFAELKEIGIDAALCDLSPWGIRIWNRPPLTTMPMLKDGRIEIQDEGSQLVALLAGVNPGQRVIDFCAGAGGKTLALAAQMNNKGRIIACDVMEKRLQHSAERFRRAGAHNIEIRVLKSERDPWIKRHRESFDRVLVDVPCSGTGTWRRNPDSRWRWLGPGLEKLISLQGGILESAARLVKPGGRLIYATCSLLTIENEVQIESFLAAQTEFVPVPCNKILDENHVNSVSSSDIYFLTTPARNGTDGFFCAVLERARKTGGSP